MVVFLFKSIAAFFAWLPFDTALRLGRSLGRLAGVVVPRHRRRALEHLAESFPEKSEVDRRRICRDMFTYAGMNMVELLRWLSGRQAEISGRIVAENEARLTDPLSRKQGVIALVSHVGGFEVMGLWGASRYPLTIITKELKHRGLDNYWRKKRAEAGLHTLPAHNSYRDILRTLKRGGCIGFILDQNMINDEGIFVDFFGRPACTTPGLAVLSAHSGAKVQPVFMVRQPDGRHVVRYLSPLDPPPDRSPASIAAATQTYTRIIEDVVRAHPEQWIWMHRRWRTQPRPREKS